MADETVTLLLKLEGRITDFEKAMAKAERRASQAGSKITSTFAGVNRIASRALGAIGLAFSAQRFASFVRDSIKVGEAIGDAAEKLGITAEAFQELAYAAEQSGTSVEALEPAFKGMAKFLGEIERGSKGATAELAALGLTIDDFKGKSPDQAFKLLLDRIGALPDPLQRNAALLKVFSRSGQELAQLATLGAQGLDALAQRARSLGLILSNETIAKAQKAGDMIAEIGDAGRVAGVNIAVAFGPALEAIRDLVTSPEFQSGLAATAANLAKIVEALAKNPEALNIFGLAAIGRFFGPGGATIGAAAGVLQKLMADLDKAQEGIREFNMVIDGLTGEKITVEEFNRRNKLRNEARTAGQPIPTFAPTVVAPPATTGGGRPPPPGPTDAEIAAQEEKYLDLKAAIELETAALTQSRREQEIANAVAKLGTEATQKQKENIEALVGALYDQRVQQDAINDATTFFAETAFDAFEQLITGASSFNDVLVDMLKLLQRALLQAALLGQGPLAGLFGTAPTGGSDVGGILGSILGSLFGGARQHGGPVTAGKAYRVGEAGPELFMPNVGGQIVPADRGAGAAVVQLHVVPSSYFDVTVDQRSAVQAQRISVEVVRTSGQAQARRRELSE